MSSAPAGLSRDEDVGRLHGAKKGNFHEIFNLTENERPLAGTCVLSPWSGRQLAHPGAGTQRQGRAVGAGGGPPGPEVGAARRICGGRSGSRKASGRGQGGLDVVASVVCDLGWWKTFTKLQP